MKIGPTLRRILQSAIVTCALTVGAQAQQSDLMPLHTMQDSQGWAAVGRLDIRGMLRALLEINYNGVVTFEYEKVAGNPVTGLAESLGYVRGLLAGMAKA